MADLKENNEPDILRTIQIDAPIQKVWQAIATSEGMSAWLMPNTFQPVMEHEFTFRSQGKKNGDGAVYCKVAELCPPNRLAFTWSGNNMEQYVSFELKELEGKTQFTMVHSNWKAGQAVVRNVTNVGWGYLLDELKKKVT